MLNVFHPPAEGLPAVLSRHSSPCPPARADARVGQGAGAQAGQGRATGEAIRAKPDEATQGEVVAKAGLSPDPYILYTLSWAERE